MHTVRHKKKLVARIRRVKGQIEAVERALTGERGCEEVREKWSRVVDQKVGQAATFAA
jgi:DNA-binding FrmR family transcriptional regulator